MTRLGCCLILMGIGHQGPIESRKEWSEYQCYYLYEYLYLVDAVPTLSRLCLR